MLTPSSVAASSPTVVAAGELIGCPPGWHVKVYADTSAQALGLPLSKQHVVVLRGVRFHPVTDTDAEQPFVVGTVERTGVKARAAGFDLTGVILRPRSGAFAAYIDGVWRLGWRVAGWHPVKKAWQALDEGQMRPLNYADCVIAFGAHLFVPPRFAVWE